MELRTVDVEDVYPDEKNPRKDFGDIAALAESCMLNAINPGEPVNPIVVVRDGGIYRIVDGERRYKAIVRNKLAQCHAVVCDDMDEANAMVAMVATDDKRQLTDIERSRGVQQMLLLGVDPVKVERTARLNKGDAMKVNKAMIKVDDAAEDMTLDHLIAIADFADDPEAVAEIGKCKASELDWTVSRLERARKNRETRKGIERICAEIGIEATSNMPIGYAYVKTFYFDNRDLDEFGSALAGIAASGDYADVKVELPEYGSVVYIRAKRAEPQAAEQGPIDPEEEAKAAERERIVSIAELDQSRRAKWLAEHLGEAESCKQAIAGFVARGAGYLSDFDVADFNEAHGTAVSVDVTPYAFALMADSLPDVLPCEYPQAIDEPDPDDADARAHAELLAALQIDGYELSDVETAFAEAFAAACEKAGGEPETEEEEEEE